MIFRKENTFFLWVLKEMVLRKGRPAALILYDVTNQIVEESKKLDEKRLKVS